jgi:glycosyltransferase involved in cell wall biosynthesis
VWRLVQLVWSERIDLVHSHLRRTDWIAAWARALCPGTVFVTTVHGEVNRGTDFRRRGGPRSAAYRFVLAHAFERVLAVSEDLAKKLAEEEAVPRARLVTLTNGVPIPPGSPSEDERRAARRALGLPEDAAILVVIGRFGRRKGHEVLLRAAAPETAAGRPWELLLLGDGDLEEPCRALANRLGLGAHAHFLGFQADLLPYLRAAEVVVVPSYSEGLPRALLEGMAMGLAPVASDIGGVREALEAPRHGLTFPAGNAEALGQHLHRLWDSPQLRREFGTRARDRVVSRYGVAPLVDRHRQLYRELLQRPPLTAGAAT